ncbi:MAG: hypothetical protein A3E78_13135, partial [Alphaproteobacteria bacterium RIFCSPHIGHO2_12_FULL_63_12]
AASEDIASIGPRLRRDLAFETGGAPDADQLRAAAEGFEKIFKAMKTTYAGINAAATFAMSGDLSRAKGIAGKVGAGAAAALDDIDDDEPSYWSRATLAECRLIEGDAAEAANGFAAASDAVDAAPGKIATTRKQLRRLKAALGFDDGWIDQSLPQGKVLYFCGPLTAAGGANPAALEALNARASEFFERHQCIAAFGALAAGADILIAEAALKAGAPLHVHLPLAPAEFLAASVAPSGGDWRERYIACLDQAQTIEWVRRIRPSRAAYRLGARIAMGRALRLTAELTATPIGFIALQSGRTAANSVSVESSEIWKSLGHHCIITQGDWQVMAGGAADAGQSIFAAVVVDGGDAAAIESSAATAPLFRFSQGTLAVLAYETPRAALETAMAMARSPAGAACRLWLDVGVGARDEKKSAEFAQTLLTASCRPQTAAGKIHASENFVYAATAYPDAMPAFGYAGFVPTEEKLDPCPMFLVDH